MQRIHYSITCFQTPLVNPAAVGYDEKRSFLPRKTQRPEKQ